MLGVLSLLGFRYDAKKRPTTNFIFAGHPHIGDDSRDNYFNYKAGPGQMIIDMTEPRGYELFETIVKCCPWNTKGRDVANIKAHLVRISYQ